MHIEHINISAPRELIEEEKKFFCDIFDVKEGFRPKFSRNGYWLYSGGNALIHLTENDDHHALDQTYGARPYISISRTNNSFL